jgi:hypothetical protein
LKFSIAPKTSELYDLYATPLNVTVIGLYRGELDFTPNVSYTVDNLYTNYNGLCKAFTFHQVKPEIILALKFSVRLVFLLTPSIYSYTVYQFSKRSNRESQKVYTQ